MLYTPAMPEHDGLSQCVVDRVHLRLQVVKETKFEEKKKGKCQTNEHFAVASLGMAMCPVGPLCFLTL